MKAFMKNRKLASKISILTTIITLAGMILLWTIIAFSTESMVRDDITDQMTNAVESRAVIIDDYVLSAEEYLKAFALSGEVRDLWQTRRIRSCSKRQDSIRWILQM